MLVSELQKKKIWYVNIIVGADMGIHQLSAHTEFALDDVSIFLYKAHSFAFCLAIPVAF